MAGLTLESNLSVANTTVDASVTKIFENGLPGTANIFTTVIPCDGNSLNLVAVDGGSAVREWLGAKEEASLRAYSKTVNRRRWESTLTLSRATIEGDKSGAVGQAVKNWSDSKLRNMFDKIVYDALLANSITGYDGQAILSNSHPNVNGSTHDNLETAALTFTLAQTIFDTMASIRDESGEPLGIRPTHLVVGPSLERLAKEIAGPMRIVPVSNAGAQDATSNVVAAGMYQNYIGENLTVTISPYILNNEYFFMDLSKGLTPWAMAQFRAPQLIQMTDMDSYSRFHLDEYKWSVEADLSPVPYAWQLIHGSVTAN